MFRRFLCLVVPALAVAGCDALGGGEEPVAEATATPSPTASASASGTPAPDAPTGGAREITEETDTFLFEYAYPQEAGEEPGLAAWLDERMERQRATLEREANEGRDEARDNGFPFNKYSSSTVWEVVAQLPGWLSLSAALDTYYGGAHPNYGFDSIVWDRENRRALEPLALFTSAEALDSAMGDRLCEALNAERAERRGDAVEPQPDDPYQNCVALEDTNVLLGSSNRRNFNRIGVQIAPYVAGPYAEGAYEFTFPVDEAVLAAVKPQYRSAFAVAE